MDKDKVFDFYEKIYFKELDEMNIILSRFPILIMGTALIINAYIFLLTFDAFIQLNKYMQLVIIIVITAGLSYLLFCLSKTFKTNDYKIIENLESIENKRKSFKEYELEVKQGNISGAYGFEVKEESAEDLFRDSLMIRFAECSTANLNLNNKRRGYFHKSLFAVWINILLCFIIMILLILSYQFGDRIMSDEKEKTKPPVKPTIETENIRNTIPLSESYKDKSESNKSDKEKDE